MNKIFTFLIVGSSIFAANAADYQTTGDGSTYTLASLSKIDGSGVVQDGETFTLSNSVIIAKGDKFEMEDGVTVRLGDGVQLKIEGTADFDVAVPVTITRASEADEPQGIYYFNDETTEPIVVKNLNFEYAGLRWWVTTSVAIDNCSFKYGNGSQSSSGELSLGKADASFEITNCEFADNDVPAIGGGATNSCGVLIDNCTFTGNNKAATRLNPQVNLTVGGDLDVVVRNCTITGSQSAYTGGMVISQMMAIEGTNNVTVENVEIRDNAYGLALYGGMKATVKNCQIIDNKYPTSAMSGGAGISLYAYSGSPGIVATGNHIEGNLWGVTVLGGLDVNFGKIDDKNAADYNPGENEFVNNGNNGVVYELYNNSTLTVYAQGNTWNGETTDAAKIEDMIYHKLDDSSLGEVIYMPSGDAGVTSAAVSNAYFDGKNKQIIAAAGSVLEVYTPSGNLLERVTSNGRTDLSTLARGLYLVRVADGRGTKTIKCVL